MNNIPLLNYNNVEIHIQICMIFTKKMLHKSKVVQFVRNKYRKDFKNFDMDEYFEGRSVTEISDMMKELLGSFI